MAGAGLINMQPYTWTPAARLAVEANRNEVAAASAMDKNREVKKKGIGGSLGGIAGTLIGSAVGGAPGAMIGGALGGLAGGAIGGDSESAMAGAGEGLGMGMAMGASGSADKLKTGAADFFKNSGLDTAADTAGSALKGAGSDGNWSIGAFDSSQSGQDANNTMSKITANSLGIAPNSGLQFQFASLGTRAMPGALGRGF